MPSPRLIEVALDLIAALFLFFSVVPFPLPEYFPNKWHLPRAICFTRTHTPVGALGDAARRRQQPARGHNEKHFEVSESRFLRTGSVSDAAKVKTFDTALGLNQAANQASQPGPAAAAAGPPTADGGGRGGAGTDAQVTELK